MAHRVTTYLTSLAGTSYLWGWWDHRIAQLQQQLQFMDGLFDVLPALTAGLVVSAHALDHRRFQELQAVGFDELHRLDLAVFVVGTAHLRVQGAHG